LVTAIHDGRRQSVAAVDAAARAEGLRPGMPLAQAQAMVQGLAVVPADPQGDARALDALAAWCLRYAPLTSADTPDGVWIDATGAAHLFGGEAALLADIVALLAGGGVAARAAIADTPGATVVPTGDAAAQLAPLPIAALRLPEDTVGGLSRLGFDRIEQLMTAHRAPIALRFGAAVHRRLDQALGRVFEPIEPVMPPETVSCRMAFPEPLLTPESLASVIGKLTDGVCADLDRRGHGARRLDLTFERVDRTRQVICIGTALPSRKAAHLARLLDEQLERVDPGLGVEVMSLAVPLTEPLTFAQPKAGLIDSGGSDADVSELVDRLVNRLGVRRVYRATPVESDVPERSVRKTEPLAPTSKAAWPRGLPRPTRLLKPPQLVEATSMLPDAPPAQFIWRRKRHRIRRADGPERIGGEWWRSDRERIATRDYWQVEDDEGRRFWLYRNGDAVDAATGDLRWFLHGIF
jgi:protein ImuB